AYTWFFVSMPWSKMVQAVRIDAVNPPFYYLYAKAITDLLGTGEAALRTPSVVAFLVGLGGSLWVGFLVDRRLGALAAGWFWAFHPMLLWFARDARPYALAAALCVLGLGTFLHLKSSIKTAAGWFVGAVTTTAIGLLTHYFFILFPILTGLDSGLDIRRKPKAFRAWAIILTVSLLPLLGWLWWFLQLPTPSFGIGWIARPSLLDIAGTLWNLISGYGGAFSWGSTAFGLVAAALGVVGAARRWRWAVLTILAPVLGTWALSQFRPVYVDRYFIVLIPFLLPLVASGPRVLAERQPGGLSPVSRRLAAAAVGCAALAAIGSMWAIHTEPAYAKEQWRQVVRSLQSVPQGTDILLSEPELTLPLSYYAPGIEPVGQIRDHTCLTKCVWILRQPYTPTHGFTQSLSDPQRQDWEPQIPDGCKQTGKVTWDTGLQVWRLGCAVHD
ncbi:MAG: hypothetical protein WBR18_00005, partial [Anaerolineales bacterium]